MTSEPCRVTTDEILSFVTGECGQAAALEMAEHLAECGACRDEAVELNAVAGGLSTCRPEEAVRWHVFRTPFGPTRIAATDAGLAHISWWAEDRDEFLRHVESRHPDRPAVRDPGALAEAERQLGEYFEGRRTAFDLPVDLSALTPFERQVLGAVRGVPFGEVVPYAEIARRIGRPRAARAVGNALHHNPVTIVVPCHRVVRKDGGLGGYVAGLRYKERLLSIEGRDDLPRAG